MSTSAVAKRVAALLLDGDVLPHFAELLKALTGAIQDALVSGRKVTLVGFGTFMVAQHSARMGRDPRTKQPISIPASKRVKFEPGKAMKEAVN